MRYIGGIILGLFLLVTLSNCNRVVGLFGKRGSGKRTSETRTVPDFHQVSLHGSGTLNITVGAPQKLTLELDDNLLPIITTEVKHGTLLIRHKESYSSKEGLKATITLPALDKVEVAGSGKALIVNASGPKL